MSGARKARALRAGARAAQEMVMELMDIMQRAGEVRQEREEELRGMGWSEDAVLNGANAFELGYLRGRVNELTWRLL